MTIGCESFDEAQLPQQRDLFRESFPEKIGTQEEGLSHYRWKFNAFPSSPAAYEYVAKAGADLVGFYAALPYRYCVFGKIVTVGMVCDVMTRPNMRGKGVFTTLGRHAMASLADAGLPLLIGYPIRPEVMPGHLNIGWKIAFQLPMYVRPLRLNKILETRNLRGLTVPANLALGLASTAFDARLTRRDLKVIVSSPRLIYTSEEYAAFVSAWRNAHKITLVKDASFMEWRLGAPGTTYEMVVARDTNGIVALAVTRRTVLRGVPCLALLDVMTRPGYEGTFPRIVPTILDLALSTGAEAVVAMMTPTYAKRLRLSRALFLKSPAIFSLILKHLNNSLNALDLSNEANWHLMWIDSDDL